MSQEHIESQPKREITQKMWDKKAEEVKILMVERAQKFPGSVLMEIAAQHPLDKGTHPNEEFRARLDRGIDLYTQAVKLGKSVQIYVPGSRHMHNGVADDISLSRAGVAYLRSQGIPEDVLHGEDLNEKYKEYITQLMNVM